MLAQSIDEVFKEMYDKGFEKGKLKGKQEILIRQLDKKLGITLENQERIKSEKILKISPMLWT